MHVPMVLWNQVFLRPGQLCADLVWNPESMGGATHCFVVDRLRLLLVHFLGRYSWQDLAWSRDRMVLKMSHCCKR